MRQSDITGFVEDNRDPAKAGRIKASIAAMDGAQWPDWIDPVFPPHMILVPDPGDEVDIILPDGVDAIEFAEEIRYKGRVLNQARPVPSEFWINYPHRRGIKTTSGHLIILDDKDSTITVQNGADSIVIQFDGSGLLHLGVKVGTDFVLKGNTFNTAHATLLGALSTYIGLAGIAFTKMATDPFLTGGLQPATISAMAAAGTGPPGAATLVAAITTFLNAAASWLSSKVKTG